MLQGLHQIHQSYKQLSKGVSHKLKVTDDSHSALLGNFFFIVKSRFQHSQISKHKAPRSKPQQTKSDLKTSKVRLHKNLYGCSQHKGRNSEHSPWCLKLVQTHSALTIVIAVSLMKHGAAITSTLVSQDPKQGSWSGKAVFVPNMSTRGLQAPRHLFFFLRHPHCSRTRAEKVCSGARHQHTRILTTTTDCSESPAATGQEAQVCFFSRLSQSLTCWCSTTCTLPG